MASNNIQMGIITRIYVKNFVTYDEVTVSPGRNLNLIIGANGTGKSTIVSAIVLGLGGSVKVIGRAPNLSDYVKAGQQNAVIEIDLQKEPNKFVTIKRCFDLQNHTTWSVNNKQVIFKQIQQLMKSLNIQVDNLCQFLPQDRVQEFSNLTPSDLLKETQRSVGNPNLSCYHTKLIDLRKTQAELEKELASISVLLTNEKQTYDSLKDSVTHINEQKKIRKKLNTLKQKKAWMLYLDKRAECDKAKKEKDIVKIKIDQINKKLKPAESKINKLISSISNIEKVVKQHNSETSTKTANLTKFVDDIEKYEKSVDEIETQCEQRIKQEQESEECISQLKQQKNKMENDLEHIVNEVGTMESIQNNLDSTTPHLNQHKNTLNELKQHRNFILEKRDNIERKIRVQQQNLQLVPNIENKRLQLLQRLSNDAYKGVIWLRANQHLFDHPIYEPMLLLINLKDAKYSKYFENIINVRDLIAFVCENKNDMNMLMKYLRDQQKLRINAVHSDPNKIVNYKPKIPLQNIKDYGFEHYLISLIDAPKTILNYLVSMYRLNNIPLGNDKVTTTLDDIPSEVNFFFSTNNSYSVNYSKYTREKSTRQANVASKDILSITVDTERIWQIQNELTALNQQSQTLLQESASLDDKFVEEDSKINILKNSRKKLQNDLEKIKNLEIRINIAEKKIDEFQNNRKSIDEIRLQYKTEIKATIIKQLQVYQQYNKILSDCYKNIIIDEEMKLQIKLKKNKLASLENSIENQRNELKKANVTYNALKTELEPLKNELTNLFEAAKKITGGVSCNDPAFAPIQTSFAKLPATLEALFEEIQATQAKMFCFSNDQDESKRILERFETAKKTLEKLENHIKENDQKLVTTTQHIEKIKNKWLPELSALVEKINENFSNYFTKMRCVGEIILITGENQMEFDKYGLQIKVKFRDSDELQVLTRNHQSGGERAVTTAVYMLSLQELTRVPFRCVDEINQGMDATNERRVFELIVKITSMSNSSQYFLLTPKLLPDLKYNDSVTVLTVFNGKFMVPCSQFDIQEKCKNIVNTITRRLSTVY